MRHTIYLPDELAGRVDAYLRERPKLSLSSLVRKELEERVRPRDTRAILELAGLVSTSNSRPARERGEDQFVDDDR
jgi:metal-responsive CopG/Arc/MetJ family transcriptional regulator